MTPLTRRTSALAVGALTAASLTALATAARADTPVPVTLSTTDSTRTLSVTDAAGKALSAANGLVIGAGKTASLTAAVTDGNYLTDQLGKPNGYQVTSTMTNLYKTNTDGSLDYSAPHVDSSAVSLGAPLTGALDLSGIGASVAPVFTLTGNLSTALSGVLTSFGLSPLSTAITSLNTQVQGAPEQITTLLDHTVNGLLSTLPFSVLGPQAGAYSTPAKYDAGDTGVTGAGATNLVLLKGTSSTSTLTGLLGTLKSTIASTLSTMTVSQAITAGLLDKASVLSSISSATGIPLSSLAPQATAILGALTATVNDLTTGLLGDTGLFAGNGKLNVTIPSSLPAGTYKGLLTVTLADVPNL